MTWSHHQKFVSIDGRIAYVGGLDLTWGRCCQASSAVSLLTLPRFDDHNFHLFDVDGKTWIERDYGTYCLPFEITYLVQQ